MVQVTYAKLTEAKRIDGGTYVDRNFEFDADDVEDICNDPSGLEIPDDLLASGYVIIGAAPL
jgi:hypothetical protein